MPFQQGWGVKMNIKLLILDVDGTMTDGKIYMGAHGELLKAFDIKDGYAIHEILPALGASAAIITGRVSDIVTNRARELGIKYVVQGAKDKKKATHALLEELEIEPQKAAFMGDDLMDLEGMLVCGLRGCPADAVREVKDICQFISAKNGGAGAVREFIEWLSHNA